MAYKKEYVINEDDLGCLNDYFYAALDQNEQKTNLIRLWEQEFGVIRRSLDKICVYSKIVKLPITFPCVTRRELALKDFEENDNSESWTSLDFKLQPGDIIQVIRKNKETL